MKVATTLTGGEDVDFEMRVLTRGGGGGSGKRRDCPLGHWWSELAEARPKS